MTSPRTPRQLLGWTVPEHIAVTEGEGNFYLRCENGHVGTSMTVSQFMGTDRFVRGFLQDHAHGETVEYRPLSEVLPETPEPPRVLAPRATMAMHAKYYRDEDGDQQEGACWCRIQEDHWQQDPIPASQSVPAVPVSSTGGKETGEAAETATEALGVRPVGPRPSREELGHRIREVWVRWAREQADPKASWLLPWEDLDDGQREVDMRMGEALFGLGMVWSPVLAPLPDSETRTEFGFEITSEGVTSVCNARSEDQARSELKFFDKLNPRVMQRTVITGPWIEVTS